MAGFSASRGRFRSETSDDPREQKRIEREIAVWKRKPYVAVGVQGAQAAGTYESGETLVDVATKHEFGQGRVPQRSFIRATMDEQAGQFGLMGARLLGQIIDGQQTTLGALGTAGEAIKGAIQRKISSNIPPPLKVRDGIALIDTGRLRNSITWEVFERGGSDEEQ